MTPGVGPGHMKGIVNLALIARTQSMERRSKYAHRMSQKIGLLVPNMMLLQRMTVNVIGL